MNCRFTFHAWKRIIPTRDVVLTEHQAELIARLVTSGRYQNASEVISEDRRMVERQESQNEIRPKAMREAAEAGITDIAAGRFRTFEGAEALEVHLCFLSQESLSALPPDADAGQ
ncbi:MAG: type II toxin-antitoxin system ParD family antitoxin [bacterium]|nr:type II toxin-antitoxin system ParD family antitoxin [bacterium]MDE0241457.1 type II toxin-antitoxin system ParD family antitoxin [bacterium]MDE0416514.1 type II toxin-antitoxin system ParD family antitoxin [bacterium]